MGTTATETALTVTDVMVTATAAGTTPTPGPECHGRPMRPETSFITGRVFHRCETCHRNTYSLSATRHN